MFYVAPRLRVLGSSLASCLWHPFTCRIFLFLIIMIIQINFASCFWHPSTCHKKSPCIKWLTECGLREELPWCGEFGKGNFHQTLRRSPREPGRVPPAWDAWYHAWLSLVPGNLLFVSAWSGQGRGRGGGVGGGQRWSGRAPGSACPSPSLCPAGWKDK